MFEIEKFSGTNDWHIYCFGMGGRNENAYICKVFEWSLSDLIVNLIDKYNAEVKYMSTDGKPWIYFKWSEENKTKAFKFYRDLKLKGVKYEKI